MIAVEAAQSLKPVVLELGGKAPTIVSFPTTRSCDFIQFSSKICPDADVETAVRGVTTGALQNAGQICMSTERVIIMRPIAEVFLGELQKAFQRVSDNVGNLETSYATLFSDEGAENVVQMISEARDAGAQVLVGDGTRQGSVLKPHIVTGVKPGMRLWDRESFGPSTSGPKCVSLHSKRY